MNRRMWRSREAEKRSENYCRPSPSQRRVYHNNLIQYNHGNVSFLCSNDSPCGFLLQLLFLVPFLLVENSSAFTSVSCLSTRSFLSFCHFHVNWQPTDSSEMTWTLRTLTKLLESFRIPPPHTTLLTLKRWMFSEWHLRWPIKRKRNEFLSLSRSLPSCCHDFGPPETKKQRRKSLTTLKRARRQENETWRRYSFVVHQILFRWFFSSFFSLS